MLLRRPAIVAMLVMLAIAVSGCVGSNPVIGDPSATTTTTGVGA